MLCSLQHCHETAWSVRCAVQAWCNTVTVLILHSEKCPEGSDGGKTWKKASSVGMWPLAVTAVSDEDS